MKQKLYLVSGLDHSLLFAGREAAGCGVDSYRASWGTTVVVAARAPCNVFDPWVHWERGQVGI